MINVLIIHSTDIVYLSLKENINTWFSEINIANHLSRQQNILAYIDKFRPQLVFFEPESLDYDYKELCQKLSLSGSQLILILDRSCSRITNFDSCVSGLLYKPLNRAHFLVTVRTVLEKIKLISGSQTLKSDSLITMKFVGIPTLDGVEYINTENIVRCEGIQKCSRVINEDRNDIISSYSLGNFAELLKPFGFELVHRSHLINLKKVRRYTREGYIHLSDNSRVPLARRKKTDFLGLWPHL